MSKYEWNEPGTLVVELIFEPSTGLLVEQIKGREIPVDINAALLIILDGHMVDVEKSGIELLLDFTSVGYDDPGVTSGPPERCYPPESDDDRTLDRVRLLVDGREIGNIALGYDRDIFNFFEEDVYEVQEPNGE